VQAGFHNVGVLGGFDGCDYDETSARLVVVGRKD
jgi:hypothetical protein